MWSSIVICVLCLQMAQGYGASAGVGAYSFSDSSGRKFGGTYDIQNGQVVSSTGNFPKGESFPFAGAFPGYGFGFGYGFPGDFFPAYFANLEGFVQEAFDSDIENQKLAINAARKAFDLTSYQADYIPNFATRFQPFNELPAYGDFRTMSNIPNSAFASAAAGPGYTRQVAAINPANAENPNVDTGFRYSEPSARSGGFYGVSSSSYASAGKVNGKDISSRGAETTINDNGKVTKYKVQS